MTLPDTGPTRKQRFDAALKLAGLTIKQWATDVYTVEVSYLHRVLTGEYPGGAEINAAIDATIAKHLTEAVVGIRESVEDASEDVADVLGSHDQ